jgi:hypothetical protein
MVFFRLCWYFTVATDVAIVSMVQFYVGSVLQAYSITQPPQIIAIVPIVLFHVKSVLQAYSIAQPPQTKTIEPLPSPYVQLIMQAYFSLHLLLRRVVYKSSDLSTVSLFRMIRHHSRRRRRSTFKTWAAKFKQV